MHECPVCGNGFEMRPNRVVRCPYCASKVKTPRKLQRGWSDPEELPISTMCGPCNKQGQPPKALKNGVFSY